MTQTEWELHSKAIKSLVEYYQKRIKEYGPMGLEEMARCYTYIGREEGSRAEPWITAVPEGNWCIQELDYRVVKQICALLGCRKHDLLGDS